MPKRKLFLPAFIIALVAAILTANSLAAVAYAAAGDLDPTFGDGGIVSTPFPNPLNGIAYTTAVQADGKIVVVGSASNGNSSFAVSRLNPDGSPDTSFGLDGSITTAFNGHAEAGSVVIQPDGKIVAGGYETPDSQAYALARYLPDGELDPTFGVGGKVRGSHDSATLINAMLLLPDGKILLAGTTDVYYNSMWIARLNPDGSLDSSFGNGGTAFASCTSAVPNSKCEGYALALQPDGKPLVGGVATVSDSTGQRQFFAVARFVAGGSSLDTSFGTGGVVVTEFSPRASAYSLAVTSAGKILAVGYTCCLENNQSGLAMAQYNQDGTPDSAFGTGGKALLTGASAGYSILLRPDGKILVPGVIIEAASAASSPSANPLPGRFALSEQSGNHTVKDSKTVESLSASQAHFALLQFNANGSLDTSFGAGGKVSTDFGGARDVARGVARAPDGKLVVVGTFYANPGGSPTTKFAVARYATDGSPDTDFGADGKTTVSPLENRASINAISVQSDGKIVAVGPATDDYASGIFGSTNYVLARYNPDGNFDTSFGSAGKTTFTLSSTSSGSDIKVASNGKIFMTEYPGFTVEGFTADGRSDPSFGTNGRVTTDFSAFYSSVTAIAIQPDGKVVAAGLATPSSSDDPTRLIMARYNTNGTLDTSFGSGGKVSTTSGKRVSAQDIAIQPDGKIIVGGEAGDPANQNTTYMALIRYDTNGVLDTSFGNGGIARVPITQVSGYRPINSIAVQSDGKIVAIGDTQITSPGVSLARVNTDGTPDTTFGSGGIVSIPSNSPNVLSSVGTVAVQYDQKLVISVASYTNSTTSGKLARYNSNGSLDTSFANGGTADVPLLRLNDMQIAPDGKIVTAGTYRGFGIARFNGGLLPGTFEDVPPTSPFYSFIECIASRNIISGYSCGGPGELCGETSKAYFRPGNTMTRGQVAKIVANAAGYSDTPTTQTFEDVPPGSPFYLYIERMSAKNIISGYPCGSAGEDCVSPANRGYFRPGFNVTRGQASKIVGNAFFPNCQPAVNNMNK